MPTRPKPVSVLRNEKRSHRTKAELEHREKAENALLTGESMVEKPEVKADDAAHAVFLRARYLLRKIGKSDALYENIINRYAQDWRQNVEILNASAKRFTSVRLRWIRSLKIRVRRHRKKNEFARRSILNFPRNCKRKYSV